MHRLLFALPVLLVIGASPAEAARHKKPRAAAPQHARYVQPSRPPWAGCLTDNGYGRYLPCDLGDGR